MGRAQHSEEHNEVAEVEVQTRSTLADEHAPLSMAAPPLRSGQRNTAASKAKSGKARGKGAKKAGWNATSRSSSVPSKAASSRASVPGSDGASSVVSGKTACGVGGSDFLIAMDAAGEAGGVDEETAFWAELQQVLAGEQLGRQFRRVLLEPSLIHARTQATWCAPLLNSCFPDFMMIHAESALERPTGTASSNLMRQKTSFLASST